MITVESSRSFLNPFLIFIWNNFTFADYFSLFFFNLWIARNFFCYEFQLVSIPQLFLFASWQGFFDSSVHQSFTFYLWLLTVVLVVHSSDSFSSNGYCNICWYNMSTNICLQFFLNAMKLLSDRMNLTYFAFTWPLRIYSVRVSKRFSLLSTCYSSLFSCRSLKNQISSEFLLFLRLEVVNFEKNDKSQRFFS